MQRVARATAAPWLRYSGPAKISRYYRTSFSPFSRIHPHTHSNAPEAAQLGGKQILLVALCAALCWRVSSDSNPTLRKWLSFPHRDENVPRLVVLPTWYVPGKEFLLLPKCSLKCNAKEFARRLSPRLLPLPFPHLMHTVCAVFCQTRNSSYCKTCRRQPTLTPWPLCVRNSPSRMRSCVPYFRLQSFEH